MFYFKKSIYVRTTQKIVAVEHQYKRQMLHLDMKDNKFIMLCKLEKQQPKVQRIPCKHECSRNNTSLERLMHYRRQ